MTTLNGELLTTGEVASRLGINRDRVVYVIETRGIQPTGWAGNLRLFNSEAVAAIRSAISGIETAALGRGERARAPAGAEFRG